MTEASGNTRVMILAQVPPPSHGQSVMVGHLVDAALTKRADRYVHVNLLLSRDEHDIGSFRPLKLLALAGCALRALAAVLKRRAREIYYVPSPAKKSAIIRDVILLGLLKPFSSRLVLHWHSVGLGAHVAGAKGFWTRRLRGLLNGHALSICLSRSAVADAEFFNPKEVRVIPNGIPDPCEDSERVINQRRCRLADRLDARSDEVAVHLLFIGLCTRSKGVFEVLEAGASLAASHGGARRTVLTVAGTFAAEAEADEFTRLEGDLRGRMSARASAAFEVKRPGFASGEEKRHLFEQADILVFPTRYPNEGLPLTILEAAAFGLPIVSTRWRGIPEALPGDYPFLAGLDASSAGIAELCEQALLADCFADLRQWFLTRFTLESHLAAMFAALTPHGRTPGESKSAPEEAGLSRQP